MAAWLQGRHVSNADAERKGPAKWKGQARRTTDLRVVGGYPPGQSVTSTMIEGVLGRLKCQAVTGNTERRIVMQTTRKRTLAKTVSWRAIATLDTFVISYLVTGSSAWAGTIAGFEVLTKVLIYYCHERVWIRINWGVVKQ